jgi:hypothetical protein
MLSVHSPFPHSSVPIPPRSIFSIRTASTR